MLFYYVTTLGWLYYVADSFFRISVRLFSRGSVENFRVCWLCNSLLVQFINLYLTLKFEDSCFYDYNIFGFFCCNAKDCLGANIYLPILKKTPQISFSPMLDVFFKFKNVWIVLIH